MLNIHVVQRIFSISFCYWLKFIQVSIPKSNLNRHEKFCTHFNSDILSGIVN